ncbi:hypothetical protein HLH34_09105 [Gluconacetobacter azotocaptans]|uniref:Uncharacterized protein n=1 Tax=Gluconacetobacter azotocaptans TaxID=142834 RepID=A0A7W4PGL8_9PROT|nr:hypothetical protein [Gluconacetobacter azotocaptans]MBB2190126.1 hypothetical protein [Gluconacetobacter azotocaptans]MBM9402895.1 hypothetical protein [Gluconacetobacter azotocaptans]
MNRAHAPAASRRPRGAPAIPLRAWCRGSVLRHASPPGMQPRRAEPDRRPGFTHHVALGCAWMAVRAIHGLRSRGVLRPRHVSRLLPVIVRMSGVSGTEIPLKSSR